MNIYNIKTNMRLSFSPINPRKSDVSECIQHDGAVKRDSSGNKIESHITVRGRLPSNCPFLIYDCMAKRLGMRDFEILSILCVRKGKVPSKKALRNTFRTSLIPRSAVTLDMGAPTVELCLAESRMDARAVERFKLFLQDYFQFDMKKEYYRLCEIIPLDVLDKLSEAEHRLWFERISLFPWLLLFREALWSKLNWKGRGLESISFESIVEWYAKTLKLSGSLLSVDTIMTVDVASASLLYRELTSQISPGSCTFSVDTKTSGLMFLIRENIIQIPGRVALPISFSMSVELASDMAKVLNVHRENIELVNVFLNEDLYKQRINQSPNAHYFTSSFERVNCIQREFGCPCRVFNKSTVESLTKNDTLILEHANAISTVCMLEALNAIEVGCKIVLMGGDVTHTELATFHTLCKVWPSRICPVSRVSNEPIVLKAVDARGDIERLLTQIPNHTLFDTVVVCDDRMSGWQKKWQSALRNGFKSCKTIGTFRTDDKVMKEDGTIDIIQSAYQLNASGNSINKKKCWWVSSASNVYMPLENSGIVVFASDPDVSYDLRRDLVGMTHADIVPVSKVFGRYKNCLLYTTNPSSSLLQMCYEFSQQLYVIAPIVADEGCLRNICCDSLASEIQGE
jgi:hypothetical protein|tara:strand:- start:3914 stop:5794 length:1881 start_codon:yes stop_codon:yes gene_type:complete